MSNSRLEKFIYAICGMDVDDLPTPLSRIETLWNCLITGEMSDFEPLSRNEKYLMAMLNGDIDGLPEPTSRSEKLLYKITTGETDLSDVPGYLSGYEELLKQLIENGGIGGTDFEYVLYTLKQPLSTLYSTAEAPVKSAILKGQTLVNLATITEGTFATGSSASRFLKFPLKYQLTNGKKYIVKLKTKDSTLPNGFSVRFMSSITNERTGTFNLNIPYLVTKDSMDCLELFTVNSTDGANGYTATVYEIMVIEYQDGIENWDIPYFEGMQSVKLPVLTTVGKNLFNYLSYQEKKDYTKYEPEKIIINSPTQFLPTQYDLFLEEGKTYVISCEKTSGAEISVRKSDGSSLLYDATSTNCKKVFVAENNTFLRLSNREIINEDVWFSNIQIEEGSTATPYEPFKSNILSTSEDVVLRGIGDIQDELDLLTVEVTERIGEVVLDGSVIDSTIFRKNGSSFLMIRFNKIGFKRVNGTNDIISSKLRNVKYYSSKPFNVGDVVSDAVGWGFGICFATNETATKDEAISYLNSLNPIVQGYLAQESVKTVVLSTLDQDGQPTKLSTFNDITHVSIEAGDLLPTIDLEVATKIEETLSTLPTLMNDISETQQLLNESIDDQAENINEVSTAITEIRSDIL